MTRSFHVGQPFTTPDADIAAALEQVSVPTLLLSLVHITGDPRLYGRVYFAAQGRGIIYGDPK